MTNSFEDKPKIIPEKLKPRSGLEILTSQEAEHIKDIFLNRIMRWHEEVKPNIIILTATSATAYGYLIKRAWRVAFPDEEQPIFMNIDLRHLRKISDNLAENVLPAKKRIKENDKILIFDEVGRDPESTLENSNLKKVTDINNIHGRVLLEAIRYLETIGIAKENLWVDDPSLEAKLYSIVKHGSHDGIVFRSPLKKDNKDLSKPSNKEHREISQTFIADLEFIGQKIGEQIRATAFKQD